MVCAYCFPAVRTLRKVGTGLAKFTQEAVREWEMRLGELRVEQLRRKRRAWPPYPDGPDPQRNLT
jgi:hypothetical protein